jgi:hypothetical protein
MLLKPTTVTGTTGGAKKIPKSTTSTDAAASATLDAATAPATASAPATATAPATAPATATATAPATNKKRKNQQVDTAAAPDRAAPDNKKMKNEQIVIDNEGVDEGVDEDVDEGVDEGVDEDVDEDVDDMDIQGQGQGAAAEEQEAAAAAAAETTTSTEEKKKAKTTATRMSNTQLREQAYGFHLLTAKANISKEDALRIIGVENTVAQQKLERDDSRDDLLDDFLAAKKDFITQLKKLQKKVKINAQDGATKNKKKQSTKKNGAATNLIQVQFLPFLHNGINFLKADITIEGAQGPAIKAVDSNGKFRDVGWFDTTNDTIVANL